MFEDLKKSIDKGLDYAFMNAEKLAQAAKDLAKENKLTKEEAKKLYDHLVKRSEEARKTMESELQGLLKTSLKKMNIPTQEDLKRLEERIKKLEGGKKTPVKIKPAKPGKTGKVLKTRTKK